jgi:uncharacterized membrane protein
MTMRKWIPAGLIVAAWLVSFALFDRLPERIPTHWGLDGQVDGWSGRTFGAFGMPAIMIAVWALCYWLPAIDPRRANYEKFRGTYDVVIASVLALMLVVHATVLAASIGMAVRVGMIVPIAVGVLLIIIGNLLPRARPNWFFGIRTPWTLSSDRVWAQTHRLGGRVMVIAGILVALSAFTGSRWPAILVPIAAAGAALVPIIYSYILWRDERRG